MPGVVAAIGSFITTTLAAGGLGAFALKLGASLLLSAASAALQKKQVPTQGRQVTSRAAVAPRDLVYGFVRKGGLIVFMDTNGDDNRNLDLIVVFASHRVKSIGAIYFDGRLAFEAGSSVPVEEYEDGEGNPRAYVDRKLGGDDQTAIGEFVSNFADGKWTSAHRLRGCAHIGLRLVYKAKNFPNGLPNITVDIEGKDDILDPRTGVRGYSANAALCLADYMSLANFGIGAVIGAADGIDEDALIEAANVCDEVVSKPGGGTERRYECNGVIKLDVEPKGIIESMLTAMAGTTAWQGAAWKIHAGAYRIPSVALTMDDARGPMSLTTRRSRADNCNAVRGQFVSPENDWQPDDFPAYESEVYLAEDQGERVYRDINLPFTTSASCAQRLAKIELERTRRQQSVSFAGNLAAWRAATGETVTLTYDLAGFTDKPFDVVSLSLGLQDSGTIAPDLILQETSPLVYDWNATEAQIYAAAPLTNLPNAFDLPAPGGVTVSESLYVTRAGDGVKARATITWTAAPTPFVAQYQVEEQFDGGAWAVVGRTDALTIDRDDIAPGMWKFRVRAISNIGVESDDAESPPVEIAGLSTAPVALTGLTLQSAGGLAVLQWTVSPDLDVRIGGAIEVRHSTNGSPAWGNARSLSRVQGAQAIWAGSLVPGTYLIRAEDSSGIPGPVASIDTEGAQVIAFTAVGTLQEDATFTGTKVNTTVASSALRLSASGGGVFASGTYAFATTLNAGSVKKMRLRSVVQMSAENVADLIDSRGDIDTWLSVDGEANGEVDVLVECRITTDDPTGSPVWGDWFRIDATEVEAWGVQARATLTTMDTAFTPVVTQLRVTADAATVDVANDAVTYEKLQNVSAASKLLGRGDAGAGDPQEITLGSGLTMTGTTLAATGGGATDLSYTAGTRLLASSTGADVTLPLVGSDAGLMSAADKTKLDGIASGANNYSHPNHSGDVTSAGDGTTTIANNAVTYAKMQDVSAASRLLGRGSAGGSGDVEEITVGNGLSLSGTGLAAAGGSQKLYNRSTGNQGAGFATDTYLTGSSIAITNGTLKAGTIYKCTFRLSKTGAGTATPILTLRFGTNGSTADTARCTFTFTAGTAAADEGMFEVWATFDSVGAGSAAVLRGTARCTHRLSVTGITGTNAVSETEHAVSSGFDSTVSASIIGLSVNGGASAAWTVQHVMAEMENFA